jgi:hypothetical protein
VCTGQVVVSTEKRADVSCGVIKDDEIGCKGKKKEEKKEEPVCLQLEVWA